VQRVLNAAAFTYVVAVLSTLVTLLRFLSIANRSRRN
jgi:Zn-dependent membrane protease YugP